MQASSTEITTIVIITTLVFLLAPAFLLVYVSSYNRRKKLHTQEKQAMQNRFDAEVLKTQVEVQERTMQTIAAELHDNIGQLLSLTSVTLSSIDTANPEKASEKIHDSSQLVNRSIKELRHLAKLFHGELVIKGGLINAIEMEMEWLEKMGNYTVIKNIKSDKKTNSKKDLIILRIVQELFNNIIKHAQAKTIKVDLNVKNNTLHMMISDDGKGFDRLDHSNYEGIGMHTIKKRIDILEGEIKYMSAESKGTTVSITIPYS